jgi:hypothetical protein
LCHRKLGLWSFTASQLNPTASSTKQLARHVDVLKEHRPYCPYVTRTASVPALPRPAAQSTTGSLADSLSLRAVDGLVEGWRAVLTVVLRHRMAQRQWENNLNEVAQRLHGEAGDVTGNGHDDEVDSIKAMVTDVKNKGVSQWLIIINIWS